MTVVAVVGLGTMGSRIAGRLLARGHRTLVWNRSAAPVEALVRAGAVAAASPAQAAGRADVVITMVTDGAALHAVTTGADGVAAGASASTTVLQLSTVAPADVSALAGALPAGTHLLDAPVLGSVAEAAAGTLKILAGGPAATLTRAAPVLDDLGTTVHVGQLGAGTAAKLVANNALFGLVGVLGEALLLARALGLEPDQAFETLAHTPLAEQAARRRPAIESGQYPPRFALHLASKDADLVADAARQGQVPLRLGAAARDWLADARAAGLGDADYTAVLGYMGLAPADAQG